MSKKLLIILYLFFPLFLKAQLFYPSVQQFVPKGEVATQNWSIVQDKNGFLLVANGNGLLLYNGKDWVLKQLPNKRIVRSLFKMTDGKILVGGQGDAGYLESSKTGEIKFQSFLPFIPDTAKNFKDVWSIGANKKFIFFQTPRYFFVKSTDRDTFQVFRTELFYHRAYVLGDTIMVREHGNGLLYLNNNKLVKLPNSSYFSKIQILSAFKKNSTFIFATRTKGLLIYDTKTGAIKKVKNNEVLTPLFLSQRVFSASKLKNGNFAFSTLNSGVIITDSSFNITNIISKKNGLSDNLVIKTYEDSFGNLWCATGNGISYIILNSPYRKVDKAIGYGGVAYTSAIYQNRFYIGGSDGLYYMEKGKLTHFPKIYNQLWSLQFFNHKLFASYLSDLLEINSDNKIVITENNENIWKIIKQIDSKHFLVGTYNRGISIIKREKMWKLEKQIKGFPQSSRFVETDSLDNIWVTNPGQGVYRLKIDFETDSVYESQFYDKTKGFPENTNNYVSKINNLGKTQIVFSTLGGIYRYDYKLDSMLAFVDVNRLIGQKETDLFQQDSMGRIWYQVSNGKNYSHGYVQRISMKVFEKVDTPFFKLNDTYIENYSFSKTKSFFNTSQGVFIYNFKKQFTKKAYNTLINFFSVNDSLYYTSPGKIKEKYNLAPKPSTIKFNFGSFFIEDAKKNVFKYKLEGYDTKWSNWSSNTFKEYTNLSAGNYSFMVVSRNVYHVEGKMSKLNFEIKAAWYQTKLMYVFYLFLIILAIWAIIKLYTFKLKQDKKRLEKIVSLRTEEINQQKEELKVIADNLKEANTLILEKNKDLASANAQIQKRNDKILESINYAQTIQRALLPTNKSIQNSFRDSFVLIKPKDIVSGDFYWTKDFEEKIVVVAADCTGHGVPGAMMSMLGIAYLNEIVELSPTLNAGLILDKLRNKVKEVFNQYNKTGDQANGMDMSLIIFDKKTQEIQFSGAMNPIYITDNQGKALLLKGNRQPIGNYRKEIDFTEQKHTLQEGDWIYMFSDGYMDQIGQKTNMRLKRAPFLSLLDEASQMTGEKQKNFLEQNFQEWKGNIVQMDDILVVGLHV